MLKVAMPTHIFFTNYNVFAHPFLSRFFFSFILCFSPEDTRATKKTPTSDGFEPATRTSAPRMQRKATRPWCWGKCICAGSRTKA